MNKLSKVKKRKSQVYYKVDILNKNELSTCDTMDENIIKKSLHLNEDEISIENGKVYQLKKKLKWKENEIVIENGKVYRIIRQKPPQITTLNSQGNNSPTLRTIVPSFIRDYLCVEKKDKLLWEINSRGEVIISKLNEDEN